MDYNILLWSYKYHSMINVKNIQYFKTAQSCSQLTTKLLQAITLTAASQFCLTGKALKIQAALLDNLHI